MGFWPAFVICVIGTAGLFYLDRDKSVRVSKALWLPVIWLWIVGSRPVSDWLGIWFGWGGLGAGKGLDAQLDGSPVDAVVLLALSVAAFAVLIRRGRGTVQLLRTSSPLLVYFLYCLISCCWSPYPDAAFKRWIKDAGDLAMALVVATDPEPIAALHRVFYRVGCILFPASVLLIRYSTLGQGYDPGGSQSYTGVTTNKNTLGLITFVILLGAMWSFFHLFRTKRHPNRTRRLIAQGVLVAFGIYILHEARSDTSTTCFVLGSLIILATSLRLFRRHPRRVHALVLPMLLACSLIFLLGGTTAVSHAYGKGQDLGDRTKIWAAVIPVCPNPIVGAGFESFWNGYGKYVKGDLSIYEQGLNSAHDGYIEVWLNLGWVGVGLILILLLTGYRRAWVAYCISPEVGGLMLAYVATVAMYNVTEAGFRILTPTWIIFLIVFVGSRRIASSVNRGTEKPAAGQTGWGLKPSTNHEFASIS